MRTRRLRTRLLTGIIGATMMLMTPLTFAQDDKKPSPTAKDRSAEVKHSGMSSDMQQAIAWEHAKDRAAERQARIEARGSGTADRAKHDKGKVKDTKAPGAKRDQ